MATWRDVGLKYGAQHIAKGINRALVEVDRMTGKAGAPIQERPSVWTSIGLGIILPIVGVFGKIKDPYDKLMVLIGGYLSTNVWDYIEEAMTAAGGGGGAAATATYVPRFTLPPTTPTSTPTAKSAPVF